MKNSFDYDYEYFEAGVESGKSLYSNYRWIPELSIPFAHDIIFYTNLQPGAKVLDYGCAKGFLVRALRLLHINCYGYDISSYAVSKAPEEVRDFVTNDKSVLNHAFDLVIAKDVLEHLDGSELSSLLKFFAGMTKMIFVIVPLGDYKKYIIPAYEADKTHKLRMPLSWWRDMLFEAGFRDIDARYSMGFMKDNWRMVHPEGNGFLIGRK